MATMTKAQSRPNWWLWGGVAAAVFAVAAIVYTFDLFGFGASPGEAVTTEPAVEQAVPAPTN